MDMLFAVPLEDVRRAAAEEGASSNSTSEAGAGGGGATGDFRRLLALMLKEATPLFLALPAGLLAAKRFTYWSTLTVRMGHTHHDSNGSLS